MKRGKWVEYRTEQEGGGREGRTKYILNLPNSRVARVAAPWLMSRNSSNERSLNAKSSEAAGIQEGGGVSLAKLKR